MVKGTPRTSEDKRGVFAFLWCLATRVSIAPAARHSSQVLPAGSPARGLLPRGDSQVVASGRTKERRMRQTTSAPALPVGSLRGSRQRQSKLLQRFRPARRRRAGSAKQREIARNRKALFCLFGLNPPQRESPAPAPGCNDNRAQTVRLQHKMLCCSIFCGTESRNLFQVNKSRCHFC